MFDPETNQKCQKTWKLTGSNALLKFDTSMRTLLAKSHSNFHLLDSWYIHYSRNIMLFRPPGYRINKQRSMMWSSWERTTGNLFCANFYKYILESCRVFLFDSHQSFSLFHKHFRISSEPFSAWCPLKGHTYLNKPAAFLFKYLWPFSRQQTLNG